MASWAGPSAPCSAFQSRTAKGASRPRPRSSRGFVYVRENEALLEELRAVVLAELASGDTESAFDRETVAARVRTAVRHFVNQRFRRKPVVLPIILEV